MPSLGIGLSLPEIGMRGGGGHFIILSANSIPEGSANNTVVGTASLIGTYTGTPSWSISDVTGMLQINSSTGEYSILDNTDLVYATHPTIPFTISETGTTPAFAPLVTALSVAAYSGPSLDFSNPDNSQYAPTPL